MINNKLSSIAIHLLLEKQSVFLHLMFTQHHGQEFIVGDMLHLSGNDVPGFLHTTTKSLIKYYYIDYIT